MNPLEGRGFLVETDDEQESAIAEVYTNSAHHELKILCEAMIEYDEMFSLWPNIMFGWRNE